MVLIRKRHSHLPPGPKGLPMVGSLHRLGSRPHEALAALAETHGCLMTLQLGFVTTIVVSSSEMATEVLQKNNLAFAGCTVIEVMKIKSHYNGSLVWAQMGPRWQALRRLCNTQLFTPQRLDTLQALRYQKVHEMVELIRQTEQVVDIGRVAFVTALNLVSNMIFSTEMVDPKSGSAQEFEDVVWSIMEVSGAPNLVDYFPMLRGLDPQGLKGRSNKLFERLHQLLNVMIDERIQSREKGGVAKGDFIGVILDSNQENGVEFRRNEILALLTVQHYPCLCYAENEK
ncbi:geraniol 8-hydroxylase [Amborella trichopoda]|nr:geraniol 8-hydroxylase [Amborella trichopoda]|eukprot:XP_006829362.2 geraniol 8-hydroxylase [Amborella trichopoda]